jgi:hypothetical protein
MKGAALARAARGWHTDARDRALGADLKNEDIVYMLCELVYTTSVWSSSSISQNFDHVYVISVRPDLGFSYGTGLFAVYRSSCTTNLFLS